jgi:hypothetical protein
MMDIIASFPRALAEVDRFDGSLENLKSEWPAPSALHPVPHYGPTKHPLLSSWQRTSTTC